MPSRRDGISDCFLTSYVREDTRGNSAELGIVRNENKLLALILHGVESEFLKSPCNPYGAAVWRNEIECSDDAQQRIHPPKNVRTSFCFEDNRDD